MASGYEVKGILRLQGLSKSQSEAALATAARKGEWTDEARHLRVTYNGDSEFTLTAIPSKRKAS